MAATWRSEQPRMGNCWGLHSRVGGFHCSSEEDIVARASEVPQWQSRNHCRFFSAIDSASLWDPSWPRRHPTSIGGLLWFGDPSAAYSADNSASYEGSSRVNSTTGRGLGGNWMSRLMRRCCGTSSGGFAADEASLQVRDPQSMVHDEGRSHVVEEWELGICRCEEVDEKHIHIRGEYNEVHEGVIEPPPQCTAEFQWHAPNNFWMPVRLRFSRQRFAQNTSVCIREEQDNILLIAPR